jgi:hypothetical protein
MKLNSFYFENAKKILFAIGMHYEKAMENKI